jgi:hypothetical protein
MAFFYVAYGVKYLQVDRWDLPIATVKRLSFPRQLSRSSSQGFFLNASKSEIVFKAILAGGFFYAIILFTPSFYFVSRREKKATLYE